MGTERTEKPACRIRGMVRAAVILGAGLAVGVWTGLEEIRALRRLEQQYRPDMDPARRDALLRGWHKAVGRSLDWAEHD